MAEIKAYMQVGLPYEFESVDSEFFQMEPHTEGADLFTELARITTEAHPDVIDQSPAGKTEDIIHLILKGAVLLKEKFPDQSLAACLQTSSIWFYG